MPACPECGVELEAEADACTLCGADLSSVDLAAGPASIGGENGSSPGAPADADPSSASTPGAETPAQTGNGEGPAVARPGADPTGVPGEKWAVDGAAIRHADYDPEEERERFEKQFGIDIGDRTVDEFLAHLDQQDYSATPWFYLVVVAELAGVALFAFSLVGDTGLGPDVQYVFAGISVLLAGAIFVDTRVVGQFRQWAKIRWTYILLSAVPLVGHLAGLLYLVLRRLMHEQTAEHRRRLLDAGFDVGPSFGDD